MTEQTSLISREVAEHVAKLSYLRFSEEEMLDCMDKMGTVLDYMNALQAVNTENVPPSIHVLPLTNVFREDEPGPTMPKEKALANAAEVDDGSFRVPRII